MKIETYNVIHHDGILTGLTVKTATIYFTLLGKERRINLWLYPKSYNRAEGLWVREMVERCKRMEREALEKLSVLISNSGHIEVPSSRYYDADALAEEILQFIEGIGMLPPEAKVPMGDFEAFLKNYKYNQDKNVYDELYKKGMLVLKNKWEPEE